MQQTRNQVFFVLLYTVLSFMALTVNLACSADEESVLQCFLHSFKEPGISNAVLFLALFFFLTD